MLAITAPPTPCDGTERQPASSVSCFLYASSALTGSRPLLQEDVFFCYFPLQCRRRSLHAPAPEDRERERGVSELREQRQLETRGEKERR